MKNLDIVFIFSSASQLFYCIVEFAVCQLITEELRYCVHFEIVVDLIVMQRTSYTDYFVCTYS